jgi:hypothetical protein
MDTEGRRCGLVWATVVTHAYKKWGKPKINSGVQWRSRDQNKRALKSLQVSRVTTRGKLLDVLSFLNWTFYSALYGDQQQRHCEGWIGKQVEVTYYVTCTVAASIKKLAADQLVKKFPVTFGTRKIITTVTRVCQWSLSLARQRKCSPSRDHIQQPASSDYKCLICSFYVRGLSCSSV